MINVVGLAPCKNGWEGEAFGPTTSSGRRLRAWLGDDLSCANLSDEFPGRLAHDKGDRAPSMRELREAAEWYSRPAGSVVLMAGRRVAEAFGVRSGFLEWVSVGGLWSAACVPHPSGLNHWWNSPRNREAARRFAAEALALAREESTDRGRLAG